MCQSLKAIIRAKIQFLRVNPPSFSQMTLKELLSSIYSPLLFFSVFSTIVFFVSSLRCPNEFTGDRCQNYVMASFYSTSTPFLSLPEQEHAQLVLLSCCCISPQIPPRARCVLPGLILTASACRMRTLTKAIVLLPLFVTSWL